MQFETDLRSDHKDLFLEARAYLLSFDGMEEIKKDRITTYAYHGTSQGANSRGNTRGNICHLRTMPHGIDLGFLKGARMNDDPGFLTGKGKVMRVLPLGKMNKQAVKFYVDQALALNTCQ